MLGKYSNVGTGYLILGVLWLIFWLGPAFSLFEADARWAHNFAIPILFIIVGFAYYSRKLSCQFIAIFCSYLTIPTFVAFWSGITASYVSIGLLILTLIVYAIERNRDVQLVNVKPRLMAWLKIHLLNLAYIGIAHMPLIFFAVRWFNPDAFTYNLPIEHEPSTTIFNAMLIVLTIFAVMERYVAKVGGFEVRKISFLWAILMIIVPLISIVILGH